MCSITRVRGTPAQEICEHKLRTQNCTVSIAVVGTHVQALYSMSSCSSSTPYLNLNQSNRTFGQDKKYIEQREVRLFGYYNDLSTVEYSPMLELR